MLHVDFTVYSYKTIQSALHKKKYERNRRQGKKTHKQSLKEENKIEDDNKI